MLAPHPELIFGKGDRLIVVAKPGDLERAWRHMSRW
jgi:Trk K+ transport system NAD-binding subunit